MISPLAGGAIIFTIAIIAIAYFGAGISSQCPSCRKYFARTYSGDELVNKWQQNDTITRRDKHYDMNGEQTGYTTRKEQVSMTYEKHLNHYKCKFCRFEWSKPYTTKYEG